MESDYDKKFAEMKKYIPFLENMIKKLEISGTGSDNPRQAQLSKIKALRDLLQERSKRMKMENLLKCEQVLINLYAKVEQRDILPGIQKGNERKTTGELETVRKKLKKVTMDSESRRRDTLPEIDRANTSEFSCSPGSKEPALFQRRPNKYSSPENHSSKSSEIYSRSKYTRVLVSPENDLYRRRSPRSSRSPRCRSPRRHSPHYKKDKKKKDHDRSGKNKSSESVNIMLNVPEDTIESLNTSDICERIMNCENSDVDINTLRDLRNQIIKELKHTKVKDSFINKLLKKSKQKSLEVEEGELSDSESEAIERIYGSLVLVNNDKDGLSGSQSSGSASTKDRRVQICLKYVPKTDNATDKAKSKETENENDLDGNTYSKLNTLVQLPDPDVELVIDEPTTESPKLDKRINVDKNNEKSQTTSFKTDVDDTYSQRNIEKQEQHNDKTSNSEECKQNTKATTNTSFLDDLFQNVNPDVPKSHIPVSQPELIPSGANFYKQTIFQDEIDPAQVKNQEGYSVPTKCKESPKSLNQQTTDKQKERKEPKQNPVVTETKSQQSEIPFLTESEMPITNKVPKSDGVTEIDILQALKNEILNEKIDIPGASSEAPALHQPKILTKVTDAKEISSKKKISIEKYKEQSSQSTVKPRIYKYKPPMSVSRGLTVKECERFNFPVEMALSDESPDEDEENETNTLNLYDDLVPKSPDNEAGDSTFATNAPIIIPAEPLHKHKTLISQTDVDMRTISPKKSEPVPSALYEIPQDTIRPKDPRLRKENPNSTPRPLSVPYPNMNPSRTPNSMSFEMTPSHGGFDLESTTSSKIHVYAPSLSYNDQTDKDDKNYIPVTTDDYSHSRSSTNRESYRSERSSHSERKEDYYSRSECPRTPSHYFGRGDRADGSSTPSHSFSRSDYNSSTSHSYSRNEGSLTQRHDYGRDMPSTPIHPFGRSEMPSTPIHPFGRSEKPSTPIHPFGRSEMPSTPIHPFGRSEKPSTPIHPFGRSDMPSTPVHPFGRSEVSSTSSLSYGRHDVPRTPVHPFGRSDGSSTPVHPFGRSDGSSTPVHPFGKSDGALTPVHPFGRSDGSSTPIHTFGRSSVSTTPANSFGTTPKHSFGRSDMPTTPIHPFGRGEVPKTPSHPYGRDVADHYTRNDISRSTSQRSEDTYNRSHDSRSDYKSHYSRRFDDSRNYSSDYRNREKSVERNHAYASDRYSSHSALQNSSDKDYGRSMSTSRSEIDRYARERSIGRISDSHDYSHSQRTPTYVESDPRKMSSNDRRTRGQSVGRSYPYSSSSENLMQHKEKSVSRQHEEQTRDRNGGTHQTNSSYYDQSFKTTKSKPFVRAQSVGRLYEKDKTVAVHSHAGRSFTIDTSVNSTFQLNLPSEGIVFDKLFDARRQRATSVGRSLHGKNVTQTTNREQQSIFKTQTTGRSNIADSSIYPHSSMSTSNKMYSDRFSRAKSVGREVLSSSKSLRDIRAEFESFRAKSLKELDLKLSYKKPATENKDYSYSSRNKSVAPDKNPYKQVRNSRKDSYESQQVDKDAYSPRRNPRDPRFNRAQDYSSKRNNYVPPYLRKDKKDYGIIYTDHNISHGKILGPMSGVKNYKIPKIKRPEPEIKPSEEKVVEKTALDDKVDKKSDDIDLIDKIDELIRSPVKNTVSQSNDGNIDITNTPKKSPQKMSVSNPKSESPLLNRSRRKNVIYDSDSDKEKNENKIQTTKCSLQKNKVSQDQVQSVEIIEPALDVQKQPDSVMFDDINDYEDTFSEKTFDDVPNNINELIAGLDQDISTKKEDQTISEKACDSALVKLNHNDADVHVSESSANNTILNEDNQISIKKSDANLEKTTAKTNIDQLNISAVILDTAKEVIKVDIQKDSDILLKETDAQTNSSPKINGSEKPTNEDMVSTSDAGDDCIATKRDNAFQIPTSCSSPDSTINTEDIDAKTKVTELLNDEPNVQTEVGSDITSTSIPVESTADTKPIQEERVAKTGLTSTLIIDTLKDMLIKFKDPKEHDKIKMELETLTKMVSADEPCTVSEDTISIKSNKSEPEKCALNDEDNVKQTDTKKDNIKDAKSQNLQLNETEIENNVTKTKKPEDEKIIPISAISVAQEFSDANVELCNDSEENVTSQLNDSISNDDEPLVRKAARKTQAKGKGKRRGKKGKTGPKPKKATNVRVTRSAEIASKNKVPRELQQLHDDLRENMFINDEVISTTGIRTCRLAKLDDNVSKESLESPKSKEVKKVPDTLPSNDTPPSSKPLVVLEKILANTELVKPPRKKPGPKPKPKPLPLPTDEHKPGPKSKTKKRPETPKFFEKDPFLFEYDSVSETTNANESSDNSESEAETLASSISLNSTTESEKLKPKRKKRTWQQGVIRTKKSKKKVNKKQDLIEERLALHSNVDQIPNIPDMNSFTDKNCCFSKDVFTYSCKLCKFEGNDIVKHYKICHSHYEIPMSRMSPNIAIESIHQSIATNFQAMKKVTVNKYVCRFCFQTIVGGKNSLENFFWHVVSTHTGEFKHFCSECRDEKPCPFMLDTPPPPKGNNNLLMGYICEKCNFTQVSLENLKSHVSIRHNDEETEVYAISLGVFSSKSVQAVATETKKDQPRALRNRRSKQNYDENSDDTTDNDEALKTSSNKPIKDLTARIFFEKDTQEDSDIKVEGLDPGVITEHKKPTAPSNTLQDRNVTEKEPPTHENLYVQTHFKVSYTKAGIKEYVCCINGNDNHYKTSLLISMKKHIQTKHQETWDGYCYFCKVIVMPQGKHYFKDCFAHYLQNHLDNIPEMEPEITSSPVVEQQSASPTKPVINVRPLSDLLSSPSTSVPSHSEEIFPKIENTVSLNTDSTGANEEHVQPNQIKTADENILFEETQKEVMHKKHRVVLDTMMSKEKLSHIFKCAGRFCSFTCNSPEDALIHASTHSKREDSSALKCAYCSVHTSGNAIDLVSHVFKAHGCCQFACGKCFYRASAVQLVESHYVRAHGAVTSGAVIKASTVTSSQDNEGSLSRNDAVAFYECCQVVNDNKCKFKTYTQMKFGEHYEHKHPGAQPRCQICDFATSDLRSLSVHLPTHGLGLYQCTWCVYGGENETDILSHLSARHPSRRPQAYLRQIMETKDGTLKQLPMVYVNNKSSVTPIEITQTRVVENPVKEAERSAELETLIGQTMQIIENSSVSQNTHSEVSSPNEDVEISVASAAITPPNVPPIEEQTTPVLQTVKAEATPISLNISEVVCLDSDDEDSTNTTSLDVSDDSNMATKLSSPSNDLTNWFKCGNCLQNYKSQVTFRYHIFNGHHIIAEPFKCYHCTFTTKDKKEIVRHYKEMHGPKKVFECSTCQVQEDSLKNIKKHCLQAHGHKNVTESLESVESLVSGGVEKYLVSPMSLRIAPKRKKTVPESSTRVAKVRRYSPGEVDLLPITQILDEPVQCSICEFTTKVRTNIIRHLKAHEQQQPVPQIAPVNPVPHLESNEMYFDKMVNLASSSVQISKPTQKADNVTKVLDFISPSLAYIYPKFIPERQRYACGAKQCSYISIDEAMLKCHWDALHSGSNDFHCVHCPPSQALDKSQPLTAARIIAHLKMHDVRLFGCSLCIYYHHQQYIVEKHITEKHNGNGEVKIVRNTSNSPQNAAPIAPSNAAPTMDLKPWQCGLCDFKSMLRQEVVEHCSKRHNSKFQYKCSFCPWRSSTLENVMKHQASHAGMSADIFYFYYREGFLPEDPNMPRWKKQRILMKLPAEPEVKAETDEVTTQPQTPITIDLNLVKKEVEVTTDGEMSQADLCKKYGEYCEPNGLKYVCPLCKSTTEDLKQLMQAHLYEELKYRKWSCAVCSYKSYHKKALQDHTFQEHRQHKEPVELATNVQLDKWIENLLNYQGQKIKENFDKINSSQQASKTVTQTRQEVSSPRPSPSTSVSSIPTKKNETPKETKKLEELEAAFGSFGSANNSNFCCPKCDFSSQEESKMYQHLESELAKIRWCCTNCPMNFHLYHMAQLHCKSVHTGQSARATEAIRDPNTREQWIQAVVQSQKQNMSVLLDDNSEEPESLLMVRYKESVPIPDAANQPSASTEPSTRRNRTSSSQSAADAESDDERLVIDEDESSSDAFEEPKRKNENKKKCQYCDFETIYVKSLYDHTLRHYNLKPNKCRYCNFQSYYKHVERHCIKDHPERAVAIDKVELPESPPTNITLPKIRRVRKKTSEPPPETPKEKKVPDLVCLICGCNIDSDQVNTHYHANHEKQIVEVNSVVLKCGLCDSMRKAILDIKSHYNTDHANLEINYAYYKLNSGTNTVRCLVEDCDKVCRLCDIDSHHNKKHPGKPVKYILRNVNTGSKKSEHEQTGVKRPIKEVDTPQKSIAKKSTTKLPFQAPRFMFDMDDNHSSSPTYTQEDTFGC